MSVTRTLMKKGEREHSALSAGLPTLPVDAGRGSVLRGTMRISKGKRTAPWICDWRRPCLEIRSKVSVMSPIIRQCAGGVRNESETGERSWRRPRSLPSSSCSASPSQAQLECALSAPRVPRCCVRPSSFSDSTNDRMGP